MEDPAIQGHSFIAFAVGLVWPLVFQVWSDSALGGVLVLWVASLHALGAENYETQSDV